MGSYAGLGSVFLSLKYSERLSANGNLYERDYYRGTRAREHRSRQDKWRVQGSITAPNSLGTRNKKPADTVIPKDFRKATFRNK
jgi:hypothetical protein